VALFSKRDHIALSVIVFLILAGWGIRLTVLRNIESDEPVVIRNAVPVPDAIIENRSTELTTIDINTAPAAELETLPMIGPSKAERIVGYRETHGPFREIADIMNVAGIGPATFDSIRDMITTVPAGSLKAGEDGPEERLRRK